jgi:hypothetical protein
MRLSSAAESEQITQEHGPFLSGICGPDEFTAVMVLILFNLIPLYEQGGRPDGKARYAFVGRTGERPVAKFRQRHEAPG